MSLVWVRWLLCPLVARVRGWGPEGCLEASRWEWMTRLCVAGDLISVCRGC